jgi:CcmD family protein
MMDVTLKDLLAEIRNLAYLFYGYTIIWVIVLGYMYSLSRREKNLRDQVDELEKMIQADNQQ